MFEEVKNWFILNLPMAIFFPLFTLIEDSGLLPRFAFNLDPYCKKAGIHGKQPLCMCMGIGCNAAGVLSCRIIESRRERLIAILTNSFIPCNGRYPALITIAIVFFTSLGISSNAPLTALFIFAGLTLAVSVTFFVSFILSKTILRGAQSGFILELPPYRRPQVLKVISTCVYEKIIKILLRAVCAAAPAGLLLWALQTITAGGEPLLRHLTVFLDPFGRLLGMDGVILAAFLLGLPANEIVIPIMLLCYHGGMDFTELGGYGVAGILTSNGWTHITAICTAIFFICHFPCATTLLTIKKETNIMYTVLAFIIPTFAGIVLCFTLSRLMLNI